MTGDVPLELLKAAVLLRKLETVDVTTAKPLKSDRGDVTTQEPLKFDDDNDVTTSSDGDEFTTKEPLKSERNVDQKVLSSLAAVCRHWSTTIKTRSDVSRQQLCLLLHG